MKKQNDKIKNEQKITVLENLSFLWTVISVLFSTSFFVYSLTKKWISSAYFAIVMVVVLLYVVLFLFALALQIKSRNKKLQIKIEGHEIVANEKLLDNQQKNEICKKEDGKTKRLFKFYKKGMKWLKIVSNILFVALSILTLVGASQISQTDATKAWIGIVGSILLIVVKFATMIGTFALKIIAPKISSKGEYKFFETKNGELIEKKRTNKVVSSIQKKLNKEKVNKKMNNEKSK